MWTICCLMLAAVTSPVARPPQTITVFDSVAVELNRDLADPTTKAGYLLRRDGRIVESVVDLPPPPHDQADARRIVAALRIEPRLVKSEAGYRPGDPWPRLGSVSVVEDGREIEIMRFITPFGGAAPYRADLTALAPFLHGRRTLRVLISTYATTGWDVTLTLQYIDGPGQRRPVFARSLFNEEFVTSESNILRATVNIPEGLDRPRLRILSTGHATDGSGGDEFITRTHILRVNGIEVARWRPWAERGGTIRELNPASGRISIQGRELWSSDYDRSGWNPGAIVWPLIVPLPELVPGSNSIELEVRDIRPPDPNDPASHRGYWRVSAIVVADEPWPAQ